MDRSQFKEFIDALRLISFGGATASTNNPNQKGGLEGLTMRVEDKLEQLNVTLISLTRAVEALEIPLKKLADSTVRKIETMNL